jgi:hypothetical protein
MRWDQLDEVKEEDIDLVVIWLKTEDHAQLHTRFFDIDDAETRKIILKVANKAFVEAKRFSWERDKRRPTYVKK